MEKSIQKAEQLYNNKKNKKRLKMLIIRYYLAFLNTEKIEYIKKAYFSIQEYLKINKTDLEMVFYICFFALEQKNKKETEKFLNIIGKYKKYLKNSQPIWYCFYIYLLALQKVNKGSNYSKYIKILEEFTQAEIYEINILITSLKIKAGTLDRDSILNINTYNQTIFLTNLIIYEALEKSPKFLSFNKDVFKNYIAWAYKNSVNIENSLNKYQAYLEFDINKESYNKRFYEKYKYDVILEKICEKYIKNKKITEVSFFFYEQAINRQINLEGLVFNYIKGCYKFNIEEIGLYPIKQFLKNQDIDFEIVAFIYHIILTNKKYYNLILENKAKILQYANYFLEKNCVGRYYYSMYKYMLDNLNNNSELENRILKIIYPIYYSYEIIFFNENLKWIFIKDNELNSIRKYEINNKKAYIAAISNNFSYYIFDFESKEVFNEKITIEKFIQDNSTKISLKFYENNMIDDFTLINLGKYLLSNETKSFNKTEILLKILEISSLSNSFKMKITQLLGNIYFKNKDYKNSTFYYKKVSEIYINDKYIGNILLSYIECFENEKAIELIKKKSHIIPESILYISLRSISENEKYDKDIAPFIYEVLMKGKIDNLFIDIILKDYNGSLLEWIELRKVLGSLGVFRESIDNYILKKTIYTHNLNKESEKIFIQTFNFNIENIIIEEFLNYCIYESIFSEYEFLDETIKIMEHIFLEYNYEELGYALAHIYLKQNFIIEEKETILEKVVFNIEKLKINFNIFEENKDKLKKYSYIFKYKPFIYNALPNKDIYFFYKEINEENYKSLKMKYFKFGIYICTLPIFFGEEIEYYFSENIDTGNVNSKKYFTSNNYSEVFQENEDDYFKINNGIIQVYEGKYHSINNLIENIVLQDYNLKGEIL